MNNLLAVAISFVYVFGMIGIAEALRKTFKLEVAFTRKLVHIGVGMWAWGTAALFTDKWAAILPPAAFVVINYVSYRRGLFLAMESDDKRSLGTVYFPIAFIALILLLFDMNKAIFVTSLMPLTWGDSFAAIAGRRYGRHRYTVFGATRSIEGSLAMFALSFISVSLTLIVFAMPPDIALIFGAIFAVAATIAEAVSPAGLDNLFVPASALLVIALFILLIRFSPID